MSGCVNRMMGNRANENFAHRASLLGVVALFVAALMVSLCCAGAMAPKASAITVADTATAISNGKWVKKNQCVYYVKSSGAKAKGLVRINGKGYLFTSKGVQRTGWRKVNGNYCYFAIANGSKGYLVSNKVVNGVKIQKNGTALVNKISLQELKIMVAAQHRVDKVAKPAASTATKLKACFKWVWKKCRECSSVKWHNTPGLHRRYAWDILKRHAGSCDSMGCGYAYLANACGAKNVKIAASGGHTWTVVYGKVCDVEQAKQNKNGWHYYMLPYAGSFYNHCDKYKISIAPRTKLWSKAKALKSFSVANGTTGWITQDGKSYYYKNGVKLTSTWLTLGSKKYYLKSNGTVATGSFKIKGTYYIFNTAGVLKTGSKTRTVKIQGVTYRVSKTGKAVSGWANNNKNLYATNGELLTGICLYKNKLWAFSSTGVYDATLTKTLRSNCKEGQSAAALLEALGTYSKRAVAGSCRGYACEITYKYDHIIVYTYCEEEDSPELLNFVDAR